MEVWVPKKTRGLRSNCLPPKAALIVSTIPKLILDSVALWLKEGVCQIITSSRVAQQHCSGLIKFPLIRELWQCFPRFAPIGTNWPFLLFLRNKSIKQQQSYCCVATIGNKSIKQEGEGEVSEWFMVLVLKTSVMQVTVGSNPTLSGFFWRCDQVVRQRIANSSPPLWVPNGLLTKAYYLKILLKYKSLQANTFRWLKIL